LNSGELDKGLKTFECLSGLSKLLYYGLQVTSIRGEHRIVTTPLALFRSRLFGATLVLTGVVALSLCADSLPPDNLLLEANRKAQAVILADIQSSELPPGGFADTTVNIRKVYRGPFHPGETLTYRSFKEQNVYSQQWREHGVIVFLVSKQSANSKQWGSTGEFFEFEYSPALEQRIVSLMRQRRK